MESVRPFGRKTWRPSALNFLRRPHTGAGARAEPRRRFVPVPVEVMYNLFRDISHESVHLRTWTPPLFRSALSVVIWSRPPFRHTVLSVIDEMGGFKNVSARSLWDRTFRGLGRWLVFYRCGIIPRDSLASRILPVFSGGVQISKPAVRGLQSVNIKTNRMSDYKLSRNTYTWSTVKKLCRPWKSKPVRSCLAGTFITWALVDKISNV